MPGDSHVVRRVGLIGDVHAEDERLRIAIAALAAEKVERILCCGDLVDGHGDVDRTCSTLALHRVTTVRGNHDRWIRDDDMRTLPNAHRMTALAPLSIDLIKSLPRTVSIDVPGGKLRRVPERLKRVGRVLSDRREDSVSVEEPDGSFPSANDTSRS